MVDRMKIEIRFDPFTDTDYFHWPNSRYFSNYKISPPIRVYDHWAVGSRFWMPYYWPTNRLFKHYLDYAPSNRSLREQRRMIYLRNPILTGIDYSYYPETKRIYRPLSLYYDYYWPQRALNYYSAYWPNYNYLQYRYTYPSDRYYDLKGRIIYSPDYTADRFGRYRIYKPLNMYYDYYYPIRSMFGNSSYWPLYRPLSSFVDDLPAEKGLRLQRIFDDETRLIRAQTASLLKRVHAPVPRNQRSWPASTMLRYSDGLPTRYTNDNYIHRLLTTSQRNPKVEYTTYYTEPVRKYIGDRAYNRRSHIYLYEDPLKSDIQLLSYYINKFRQEKSIQSSDTSKVPLSASRPSRKFSEKKLEEDNTKQELKEHRDARAERWAKIYAHDTKQPSSDVDDAVKAKKKKEDARLAEEKALAEEQARNEALAKKEDAARKAELARQEELAAQAAAERAAELEKQAELTRQKEQAKQAEIDKARKQEEERLRLEEQKRLEEEAKAEEERKQLLRLEELARQAEEEKEAELARQADELAELARQEAELAEQAKKQAELDELARQEAELADLERQEAELAELEQKEKELAELAKQEAEVAEQAKEDAEAAKKEAELAELAQQEAELAELERQQAELDALEAEAKALEADDGASKREAELAELAAQEAELAELERQQAELDALEAEAKALEAESAAPAEETVEEEAAVEEEEAEDDAAEADVTSEEPAAEEEEEEE